jgi:hypothetical protein
MAEKELRKELSKEKKVKFSLTQIRASWSELESYVVDP